MLKKILFLVPVLLLMLLASGQDTAAILSKVQMIPASEAEQKDAILRTENLLKNNDNAEQLFGQFLIIGASLWNKLKDLPDFKNAELTNVMFKLPVLDENGKQVSKTEVSGKAIQEADMHKEFWKNVYQLFDLTKARIADFNTKDKFIYWLYFAKIEEPIIMVNSGKGRLLLKFVQGKLFFIELI
jgi:hypothetical protein